MDFLKDRLFLDIGLSFGQIDSEVLDQANISLQSLTPEDKEKGYSSGVLIFDSLPMAVSEVSRTKIENWIKWRGAPYPAQRHSEYLFTSNDIEPKKGESQLKIMISAVLLLPESMDSYLSELKPKKRSLAIGRKASKLGYYFKSICPKEHSEEIWNIIHSSKERQGREIASIYDQRPPNYDFPDYLSYEEPELRDICVGVFSSSGELVAYLLGKRVGHHITYDEILGHVDHWQNEVMYLLHFGFLSECFKLQNPPRCLNYGGWYSGKIPFSPTVGLNRWKRNLNYQPMYLMLASF